MGKYLDAKCKLCRRAGEKLYLKGDKCFSPKCPIVTRNFPPGVHGPVKGHGKLSTFGIQLKEKQKARRTYGIAETQLRNYFEKAVKTKGNSGEALVALLETRLDNVVYRMGFAPSRTRARQLVGHGHMMLNGKKVNTASIVVKAGDVITFKARPSSAKLAEGLAEQMKKREVPTWISVDPETKTGKVLSLPAGDDLAKSQNFDVKMIVEFYSR